MAKFELGRVVVTKAVSDKMSADYNFDIFVKKSLGRYHRGDWGNVGKEDAKSNNDALENGERILAVYSRSYSKSNDTIWIITEADRSVTTILFPSEY